jgi:hypothetical protein
VLEVVGHWHQNGVQWRNVLDIIVRVVVLKLHKIQQKLQNAFMNIVKLVSGMLVVNANSNVYSAGHN